MSKKMIKRLTCGVRLGETNKSTEEVRKILQIEPVSGVLSVVEGNES